MESGIRSKLHGDSFWDSFVGYLNDNWAQTVGVSMAIAMVSFGVSQAAQAIKSAAGSKALANSSCTSNCFKAGTLVLCLGVDGKECHKAIEDVEEGNLVWAYDEETGESDWKPVVRLFRNETEEWYHIHAAGEEIVCTGGHPFYVVDKGFVRARDLVVQDRLLLADKTEVAIEEISVEKLSNAETTYNFEVQDFHTYFVTESNVLVHNKCAASSNDELLQFKSRPKLEEHFAVHGSEFEGLYTTADEYLNGANYVVQNGTYVPEMNGYLRFFGAGGKANYAFVGLTQDGNYITTFGIRAVETLKKVPWLLI